MSAHKTRLVLAVVASILLSAYVGGPASRSVCPSLDHVRNKPLNASPIIAECLSKLKVGAVLQLVPGTYTLLTPLRIEKAVTLKTLSSGSDRVCSRSDSKDCAILAVGEVAPQSQSIMPIEIQAAGVRLQSMAIVGQAVRNPRWAKRICLNEQTRPLGGGIRVHGDSFTMTRVLLKDFSCYTAMEVSAGVKNVTIVNSTIGSNGQHDQKLMWADGITIHDASNAIVQGNHFVDNTDVQLILGGCRFCVISKNTFRHTKPFKHASFAALMIHAWPNTSGDFTGTQTTRNDIDCNVLRRCGYGIMIGGEPWYPAKTFGGAISDNHIRNARMGLNIDQLTGPMTIQRNVVDRSGGMAAADCGYRKWPSVNVSPASIQFLKGDIAVVASIKTANCLLNRTQ